MKTTGDRGTCTGIRANSYSLDVFARTVEEANAGAAVVVQIEDAEVLDHLDDLFASANIVSRSPSTTLGVVRDHEHGTEYFAEYVRQQAWREKVCNLVFKPQATDNNRTMADALVPGQTLPADLNACLTGDTADNAPLLFASEVVQGRWTAPRRNMARSTACSSTPGRAAALRP
mgnify:CR=1 FL=1